jgi:transposase
MGRAADLRGEGLSLRQIAAKQGVSKDTVMRDLAAWDEQQEKVSHLPVSKLPPRGGNETAPRGGNETPSAEIVPLRRSS